MNFPVIFRQTFLFLAALTILCGGLNNALAQQQDDQTAAIAQFEQGQDAHERGETAAALKFYEKAIELQPDFPEAEYQSGIALEQLGREDEAEQSYRRAIELRADWPLPMTKLGALLIKKGDFDEAEKILTKAVELDAANSAALVALTELEINSKAAPDKQQILLNKIKANTDGQANAPSALWTARAALERNLGLVSAAKSSISTVLQLAPADFNARLLRGEIFLGENNFAAALDDAKFALHAAPENLSARLLLSRIDAAQGNFVESLKILDALDPEQKKLPIVVELKKTISINEASNTDSLETLKKLLETDAKNALLLNRLCALTRTVNPIQALEYCRRAAELEPTNPAPVIGYGAALVQARQFENAIVVLRRILTIVPDDYTARANLATALYEAKRFPEAIVEFKILLTAKPDVPASYFFLATANDTLGYFTEAMTAYQKFLELANPTQNQLEIDKVKLRLPGLTRQIEKGAGKKKP